MRMKELKPRPVKKITEAPVGIGGKVTNWLGRKAGIKSAQYKTEIANDANELYKDLVARLGASRRKIDQLTKIELAKYLSEVGYREASTPVINKLAGNLQPTDTLDKKTTENVILSTVEAAFLNNTRPRQGKFAKPKNDVTLDDAQKQALIAAGWTPPS